MSSRSKHPIKPKLLILEDEDEPMEECITAAISSGWEPIRAQNRTSAEVLVRQYCDEITVLIVDLMVPDTEEKRRDLETTIARRDELSAELFSQMSTREASPEFLLDGRQKIDALDEMAVTLQNVNGGFEFLDFAFANGNCHLVTDVIIVTNRELSSAEIQSRCQQIASANKRLHLIRKSLPEGILERMLHTLKQIAIQTHEKESSKRSQKSPS